MSLSGIRPVDRIQENLIAYFRLFAGLPGVTFVDEEVTWFTSPEKAPGNHVLRARLADESGDERIDAFIGRISQTADQVDWLVFPACAPADLGGRLEARGMKGGPGGTWMTADLTSLPREFSVPERFRISRVTDSVMLADWARLSSAGFGQDTQIFFDAYARHGSGAEPVSLQYIGYLDDKPVTSSTLLVAGGIAGMFDISTPPAFRGQGFGSAITRAMMQEARNRGYPDAWAWSSPMGKGVYARLGFVAADLGIREYQWRKHQGFRFS